MSDKKKPQYTKAYEPLVNLVFNEPIAIPLTPIMKAMRVHPNIITLLSLLTGLLSGIVFAMGYWIWAALIFHFTCFCDCLDGKVARYCGLTSEFGAKLDGVADSSRKPSSFLGVGIYFFINGQKLFAILTIVVLCVHLVTHKLYGIVGVLEYDLEFPTFHRKVLRRFAPRMLALYTFFEEQFIVFTVFPLIAAAIGLPKGAIWFFYGAVIVTFLSLGKLMILWNYRRKGRYELVHQDWAGTKGKLDNR